MTADKTAPATKVQTEEYLYKDLTYLIRGAFFEVYNQLGPGFKEDIYHQALAAEFRLREIPFAEKVRLGIGYKGKRVGVYEPDFIVDDKVIVEIKSLPHLPSLFETQLYYYLKGTEYRLGFLVNFGGDRLDIRRRIFDAARISGHLRSNLRKSASSDTQIIADQGPADGRRWSMGTGGHLRSNLRKSASSHTSQCI